MQRDMLRGWVHEMKKLLFTLAVVAVAVAAVGIYVTRTNTYNRPSGPIASGQPEELPVTVEVAPVERRSIRETARYVGSVEASESVTVLPKVTGILETITVDIGDRVSRGDVIALVDDDEFVQRVEQAKANLKQTEARLERSRISLAAAEREFARIEKLAGQGLSTDQQLDSAAVQRDGARADIQLAEADVDRARASLDEAEINVANTRIKAPLSGYVDKRRVDAGALVSPSTALCTVVTTDPVKVGINVPEKDIQLLEAGRRVVVKAGATGIEYAGRIERIAPTVDIATRTTVAEIVVPNPAGALRPGMYADVLLVAREKSDVLTVPEEALVRGNGRTAVMRVVDGRARAVRVTLGILGDGSAEVLDGLQEGDLVIVKGQYLVEDGDPVRYQAGAQDTSEAT